MENQLIPIGEILKPRGLKGEVKVKALNGEPTRFFNVKKVFIDERQVKINKCSCVGTNTFLFLDEVGSVEEAEKLRGKFMCLPRDELDEPQDGYFVIDLIGATVESETGEKLGIIVSIDNYGAGDIIECSGEKLESGKHQTFRFVFLDDIVKEVDVENKKFVVYKNKWQKVVVFD